MRTIKSVGVVILGFLIIVLAVLVQMIEKDFEKAEKSFTNKIGQHVVLGKDTLMIIDYSLLQSNFVLEDGRVISKKLAEDHLIIKK